MTNTLIATAYGQTSLCVLSRERCAERTEERGNDKHADCYCHEKASLYVLWLLSNSDGVRGGRERTATRGVRRLTAPMAQEVVGEEEEEGAALPCTSW